MIKSFTHKGLQKFFETGSKSGIIPNHANRLNLILTILNTMRTLEPLNAKTFKLHPLHADMDGHWSIMVNGNWRITFRFDEKDKAVYVVDYQDYH